MYDELCYNARQAVAHIRRARNVLGIHEPDGQEEYVDPEHRLRSALALVDAAYVEVGRLERLRSEDPGSSPPAARRFSYARQPSDGLICTQETDNTLRRYYAPLRAGRIGPGV